MELQDALNRETTVLRSKGSVCRAYANHVGKATSALNQSIRDSILVHGNIRWIGVCNTDFFVSRNSNRKCENAIAMSSVVKIVCHLSSKRFKLRFKSDLDFRFRSSVNFSIKIKI